MTTAILTPATSRLRVLLRPGAHPSAAIIFGPVAIAARRPGRHNPNVPDIIPEPLPRLTTRPDAPFIYADAHIDGAPPPPVQFDIRGKVGQTVYQMTHRILPDHTSSPTPELQRRRMVVPTDPRTTAQLQLRARFGRAVQHWRALSSAEQATWNRRGHRGHPWLEGLNLFIKEWSRAHPPEEFATDAELLRTTGSLPPLP